MSLGTIFLFWVAVFSVAWGIVATLSERSARKKYKEIRLELDKATTYADVEEKIDLAKESLELIEKEKRELIEEKRELIEDRDRIRTEIKEEAKKLLETEVADMQAEFVKLSEQIEELKPVREEIKNLGEGRDNLLKQIKEYEDIAAHHPMVIDMDRCKKVIDTIISTVGITHWGNTLIEIKKAYAAEIGWLCRRGYVHSFYGDKNPHTFFSLDPAKVKLSLDNFDLQYAKWKNIQEKEKNKIVIIE